MENKKYFVYSTSGNVNDTLNDFKNNQGLCFYELFEVFDFVSKHSGIKKEDLYIRYYCFDKRFLRDIYLITTTYFGKKNVCKKYGCPQSVGFFMFEV